MVVGVIELKVQMPWVHSLKEKRMVVKSLCAKVRNKYNVSIAEIREHDLHQVAVLGLVCVSGEAAQADSIMDNIINFMEGNTEAEIIINHREILRF